VTTRAAWESKILVRVNKDCERLALHWARKGDWSLLASHVSATRVLGTEVRAFLAAVLRQEVRRPNNRAPTFLTRREKVYRASLVYEAMERGVRKMAAIDKAAIKTGVDGRTIDRDVAELASTYQLFCLERDRVSKEGRRDLSSARYEVSGAALTPHFVS